MLGSSINDLVSQLDGEKPFRAKQIFQWIHKHGVLQGDKMLNVSKELQQKIGEIPLPLRVVSTQESSDGTVKWLFDVGAANYIETVFIPEQTRGTLCISSQVGCTVDCKFCFTGTQGFNRNLTSDEIVAQLFYAYHTYGLGNRLTNVVMMGMGEPLLNYKAVLKSLQIFTDDMAYGLGRRRVTVSTSGVVPKMDALAETLPVAMAVSLHATNDELRDHLVPLNKKYKLDELLTSCANYQSVAPRGYITFEYVMLDKVNDTIEDAKKFLTLVKKHNINCKVNLIPFNPYPGARYQKSSNNAIHKFADHLKNNGLIVTVRKTRGDDILAACGQLKGHVLNRTKLHK